MSSEFLLQLLQRFIKRPNQIKQIHSLLITKCLLFNFNFPQNATILKWKTTLLYNALIRAYAYININPLQLFTCMLRHQTFPNPHTFTYLFKAASISLSLPSVTCTPLHAQALKRGVLADPFVQTSLLGLYAKLGSLSNARQVFEEIYTPCIVARNAMLDAFVRNGDMGSALLLFERMIEKDVISWTIVINGFARSKQYTKAIRVFEKMVEFSAKPSEAP